MKRLAAGLLGVSVLIIGWTAIQAATEPPKKKLGPEWTKDKDDEYIFRRKMEIEMLRRPSGWDFTVYAVPMENHKVDISEYDENRGASTRILQRGNNPREDISLGELQVCKDLKGKVYKMRVELHDNIYFDLDGDGMIDAFIDKRGGKVKAMIVFEGRFLQVELNKSTFGGEPPNVKPEVWCLDHRIIYILEGGLWKIKK